MQSFCQKNQTFKHSARTMICLPMQNTSDFWLMTCIPCQNQEKTTVGNSITDRTVIQNFSD